MSKGKIIKDWWDNAALFYQKEFNLPIDDIYYGPFCPSEKELNLLNVDTIQDKKILELGCGGGQNGIFLTNHGAVYSGIDISKEQIEYAKKLAKNNHLDIDYSVDAAENLKKFHDNTFDLVISIFAIQYVKDIGRCFREIRRVLKDDGGFIFSLDHPFYSVVSPELAIEFSYHSDEVSESIKTSNIISQKTWPGGDKQKFSFYYRKISDFYSHLVDAGLFVTEIKEPVLLKSNDPWSKVYSKKLAEYIPPTIIFIVKK